MQRQDDKSTDERVEEAAALWVARLQSGDATERDRLAFDAWLRRDPSHAAAYEEMRGLWADLRNVPIPESRLGRLQRSRRLKSAGAATAVLAMLVAAGLYQAGYYDRWRSDYYTVAGEVRSVRLEDGTRVDLNTDTAIAVRYSSGRRDIRLLRGEAFFDVAKNPQRPFTVDDGALSARAVGTRYSVRKAEGTFRGDVQVEEGRVEVNTSRDRALVQPDQVATVIDADKLAISHADVTSRTAWKEGKLVFSERPLKDVLATLARYRAGRIVLLDAAVGDLNVSGVFDTDNTDEALDALQASLPVSVTRLTDMLVLVRSR